jgi:hypothetical protein
MEKQREKKLRFEISTFKSGIPFILFTLSIHLNFSHRITNLVGGTTVRASGL